MQIQENQLKIGRTFQQIKQIKKLDLLAFSARSQQYETKSQKSSNSIKSSDSQKSLEIQQKQSQSTQTNSFLSQLSLKNIKSKQQIQQQSKENQSMLLNLNSNIDDLFKKIFSLTDQINVQLKTGKASQYLKQKNIQFQSNLPSNNKQKQQGKIQSSPQISLNSNENSNVYRKQYNSIFLRPIISQQKSYSLNMKLFQVGKNLGYGKFGDVLACKNIKTNCIYSLKKIFKSIIQQYNMQNQLLTELKILSSINHPNIVKTYQAFTDQYHIFILMQYIQGNTLIKKFKSPEKQIKSIIRQVLNALKYLHQKQICHRDIKPQNIILTANNIVKICDFGWSSQNQQEMNILCGTLDYVSYQMAAQLSYTKKVDLWNVGVLTYQLVYGYPPFKDSSKSKTFENVKNLNYQFQDQKQISLQCKQFIKAFLKPEAQRITIQEALQHSFLKQIQDQKAQHQQSQKQMNVEFENILEFCQINAQN